MSRKKKKCSQCTSELVAETNFNKNKTTKDGYRSECKLCQYKGQLRHLQRKVQDMEDRRYGTANR